MYAASGSAHRERLEAQCECTGQRPERWPTEMDTRAAEHCFHRERWMLHCREGLAVGGALLLGLRNRLCSGDRFRRAHSRVQILSAPLDSFLLLPNVQCLRRGWSCTPCGIALSIRAWDHSEKPSQTLFGCIDQRRERSCVWGGVGRTVIWARLHAIWNSFILHHIKAVLATI